MRKIAFICLGLFVSFLAYAGGNPDRYERRRRQRGGRRLQALEKCQVYLQDWPHNITHLGFFVATPTVYVFHNPPLPGLQRA